MKLSKRLDKCKKGRLENNLKLLSKAQTRIQKRFINTKDLSVEVCYTNLFKPMHLFYFLGVVNLFTSEFWDTSKFF